MDLVLQIGDPKNRDRQVQPLFLLEESPMSELTSRGQTSSFVHADDGTDLSLAKRILEAQPTVSMRESYLPIREAIQLDLPAARAANTDAIAEGARITDLFVVDDQGQTVQVQTAYFPSSIFVGIGDDGMVSTEMEVRHKGGSAHIRAELSLVTGIITLSSDKTTGWPVRCVRLSYGVFEDLFTRHG